MACDHVKLPIEIVIGVTEKLGRVIVPNTMYSASDGIASWIGVSNVMVPDPLTDVSKGPRGDSIVEDGVNTVTTLSLQRPNNVACAIRFTEYSAFRFNRKSKYLVDIRVKCIIKISMMMMTLALYLILDLILAQIRAQCEQSTIRGSTLLITPMRSSIGRHS